MKIGIDARLYGPKHTGIGRYTQNLLLQLINLDQENKFVLFGDPDLLKQDFDSSQVDIVPLKTGIYSFSEQIVNLYKFKKQKLDLLHVPHFNAPILYDKPVVITLHDLIKDFSTGVKTSTLPAWQYQIKRLGYKLVLNQNLKKAKAIITPSHYWKNYLINNLSLDPQKISVTYEAVSGDFKIPQNVDKKVVSQYKLKKPFIIYTGNLYPHKNVDFLVKAVKQYNKDHHNKVTLALISARDAFHDKFSSTEHIKPLGYVPDEDLVQLYAQALALVQPSLLEGFGLTGLEAMKVGLPVLSSSASCLPEVYSDAALYFDPHDQKDFILKLEKVVQDQDLRQKLSQEGKKHVTKFSWKKTALQTLQVYQQVLSPKS